MHAVLAAAIANPRFARPYGSDRGEWGFPEAAMAADTFGKVNSCPRDYGNESDRTTRTIASGRAKAIGTYGLN